MSKYQLNRIRYKYPLPVRPIEPALPDIIIYNPISWCYFIYEWYKSSNSSHRKIPVTFTSTQNGRENSSEVGIARIMVTDKCDMMYLWENGFFGSGTLSRSEPTWRERSEEKLALANGSNSQLNLEKITEWRRLQRLKFKKEREKYERELLQIRQDHGKNLTIEQEQRIIESQRESLRLFKQKLDTETIQFEAKYKQAGDVLLPERSNIDIEIIRNLETLELQPIEAFFLTWSLPILSLGVDELFTQLFGKRYSDILQPEIYQFIIQYVSYHHYRSHGWCVRSGIKFGSDYLLYKRGPPFQHAEFCIMVMDPTVSRDYTWYSTISRVCGVARKTMILCYVEPLVNRDQLQRLWHDRKYTELFGSFQISEVIYKRWTPGKNRD